MVRLAAKIDHHNRDPFQPRAHHQDNRLLTLAQTNRQIVALLQPQLVQNVRRLIGHLHKLGIAPYGPAILDCRRLRCLLCVQEDLF